MRLRDSLRLAAALSAAAVGTRQLSVATADANACKAPARNILREGSAFQVYRSSDGSPTRLAAIVDVMASCDVVLLGEYHDDPVAHALELELLRRAQRRYGSASSAAAAVAAAAPPRAGGSGVSPPALDAPPPAPRRRVVLSLEMFERDTQEVVDEFLAGRCRQQDLERDARAWPNYAADYAPLVELARAEGLPVVAANAPRRYVSLAGRRGRGALAALGDAAKAWLAPLPYPEPSRAYIAKVDASMRAAGAELERQRADRAGAATAQHPADEGTHAARSATEADSGDSAATGGQPSPAAQQRPAMGAAAREGGSPGPPDPQPSTSDTAASPDELTQPSAAALPGGTGGSAAGAGSSEGQESGAACPYIGLSVTSNFLDAQALWDATMAHSIARMLHGQLPNKHDEEEGGDAAAGRPLVIHVCGQFHCARGLGIPEALAKYSPASRVVVVTFQPAHDVRMSSGELREAGLLGGIEGGAGFVCVTDGVRPRSYVSQHPV